MERLPRLRSKTFPVILSLCLTLGAIFVPLGAFCASDVNIPFSRPSSSNSGFIFLSNDDGSKWFALTLHVFVNNTELGGASSSETNVSQQDANSSLEALAGGVYLQLELDATTNNINQLGMAYADTANLTAYHSGEKINKERSDIIYLYQYCFFDGTRIYQTYGFDPGKVASISFPEGWRVNPASSASSFLLYGEVGGNISLKVIRHRASDNKYLGGPYGIALTNGGPSWSWKNDQIAIVGDIDAHIATTPAEQAQAGAISSALASPASVAYSSGEAVHSGSDRLIDLAEAVTPAPLSDLLDGFDYTLNPGLAVVPVLLGNNWTLTLCMVSLTLSLGFVLLRGVHK